MTATVAIPQQAFRDALRSTLPATAAKTAYLPVLEAVRITVAPTEVKFIATDRFVVARYTITDNIDHDGESEPHHILVKASDVKAIIAALPTRGTGTVTLTIDGDRINIATQIGITLTYVGTEGDFPNVEKLIPDYQDPQIDGRISFGVPQLTQLTTAAKTLNKNAELIFSAGATPTKPVRVATQDPNWTALIMPRRIPQP